MRFAGMNHIVITGRCPNLSYLYIHHRETKIIDAKDLESKSTTETEKIIKGRHGNVKALCIGPAGENLVQSSCIIADGARAVSQPFRLPVV
jgi:aldehyde:ferredoxin oxidoreductase